MAKAPRISGPPLRSLARLARTAVGGRALYQALRGELRIGELRALPEALRGDVPIDNLALQARRPRVAHDAGLPTSPTTWSATSASLAAAYREGSLSPEDVVRRVLSAARDLSTHRPSVGPLLEYGNDAALEQAAQSTRRYRENKTLGILDGVPFAVKEQLAVRGFARRSGTNTSPATPEAIDATCVARLRAMGAIIVGTTAMTEFGMSPLGHNAGRVMPRNPHATGHVAGGSSTGSAVAVATGIVPFALGADGGGSIRIPSSVNGVFGIKPTWGRVSRAGDTSTGTVAHVGPIASSPLDLARVIEAIAASDPADPQTAGSPILAPGSLEKALGRGVRGLRVGVDEREWAAAEPEIARAGRVAIDALAREGAEIVSVRLELARFAASIGYLVIGTEALAALRAVWTAHGAAMTPDLQVSFGSLEHVSAADYTDAQRLRTGLRNEVRRAFESIDLLALPTTATTATAVTDAQMEGGFLDAAALDAMCRFNFLGNLTGLPAASMPVGLDGKGLPIGFQLVGDAWDEATVLAAAAHLERVEVAKVRRPRVSVRLLG